MTEKKPPRPASRPPAAKASTVLRVGEFAKARIVAAEGHDLVGEPI